MTQRHEACSICDALQSKVQYNEYAYKYNFLMFLERKAIVEKLAKTFTLSNKNESCHLFRTKCMKEYITSFNRFMKSIFIIKFL